MRGRLPLLSFVTASEWQQRTIMRYWCGIVENFTHCAKLLLGSRPDTMHYDQTDYDFHGVSVIMDSALLR